MKKNRRHRTDPISIIALVALVAFVAIAPPAFLAAQEEGTKEAGAQVEGTRTAAPEGWFYRDVDVGRTGRFADDAAGAGVPTCAAAAEAVRFRIIFRPEDPGAAVAAAEIAALAPEVARSVTAYMGYTPSERIPVVLRGRTAYANGFFTPLPPHIELFVSAPSRYDLASGSDSWMKLVFTHELIHYLHLTRPRGFFGVASRIFGPLAAAGSYLFMPGWMVEGPTVHGESVLTQSGRGSNPFFEMTWLAPVMEGTMYDYDEAGYAPPLPPTGRIYSAGYLLTDYIHRTYGAAGWHALNDTFMDLPFLGMRRAIRRTTGITGPELFRNMVHEIELRSAERFTLPEGSSLTPTDIPADWHLVDATDHGIVAWMEGSRTPGALYLFPSGAGAPVRLLALSPTDERSITVDRALTRLVVAVTVPDYTGRGGNTSWSDLYVVPLSREKVGATAPAGRVLAEPPRTLTPRRLTEGGQYLHPALSPDGGSLVALRRRGSYMELVEVSLGDGAVTPLYTPAEARLHAPHFSHDGRLIAVVQNDRTGQDFVIIDAATGGIVAVAGDPEENEYDPRFVRPGDAGTTGGRQEGYRLFYGSDGAEGRLVLKEVTILPSAARNGPDDPGATGEPRRYHGTVILEDRIGAYAGLLSTDGEVIYGSYRNNGYSLRTQPYREGERPPASETRVYTAQPATPHPVLPQPGTTDRQSSVGETRPYRDVMRPVFWFPVASFRGGSDEPSSADVGLYLLAASNLSRHILDATATYNETNGDVTGALSYTFRPGSTTWTLSATREPADDVHLRNDLTFAVQRPLLYRRAIDGQSGVVGALATTYRHTEMDNRTSLAPGGALRLFSQDDGAPGHFYGGTLREATSQLVVEYPLSSDGDEGDMEVVSINRVATRLWIPNTRLYVQPAVVHAFRRYGNAGADLPVAGGGFDPTGVGGITETGNAVLAGASIIVDLGPYDGAWRGLASSGSALSLFVQQPGGVGRINSTTESGEEITDSLFTPDNFTVFGAELAGDLYFNTIRLRLSGGVSLRLPHTGEADQRKVRYYINLLGGATERIPAVHLPILR